MPLNEAVLLLLVPWSIAVLVVWLINRAKR